MIIKNYPNLAISPLNENAGETLQKGTEKLANYWLSAGTLLGFYRQGDFIPGDTDIDIEMIGFPGIENYIMLNTPAEFEVCRTIHEFDKLMQIAFIYKGVIFDIYIYWEEGTKYLNRNEEGEMYVPKRMYDQRGLMSTKYGPHPVPVNLEGYLEFRYGDDWKTPSNKKGLYNNDF